MKENLSGSLWLQIIHLQSYKGPQRFLAKSQSEARTLLCNPHQVAIQCLPELLQWWGICRLSRQFGVALSQGWNKTQARRLKVTYASLILAYWERGRKTETERQENKGRSRGLGSALRLVKKKNNKKQIFRVTVILRAIIILRSKLAGCLR